jgi:LuxR family maltose regulon positive regulatory protein
MADALAERARGTVLESKHRTPRALGSTVQRTKLLSAMATGEESGATVTIVSAPAGAGKTMLLAQRTAQLRAAQHPVGWFSLDSEDNDPFTLWSGILIACARGISDLHPDVAHALAALAPPPDAPDRGFLGSFFSAIEPLPSGLWLVLDDVHEISSHEAISALARLLKNKPPGLRLILGCRYDPPLPLPRMILQGAASELRAADLAFNQDEAREMLIGHGIQLPDTDLGLLLDRTEGWAAGLRLATLSLSKHDDPSKHVAAIAGDDRPLADYLVSEVLAGEPADVVTFLLTTAVPELLTVELARELSGRDDAGAILHRLAHDNALVNHHDSSPATYRYHSLFRSYLLAELDRRDSAAESEINRTASRWFGSHGAAAFAIDHAARAQDWESVTSLVNRHGLRLLLTGDGDCVSRVLRVAPAEALGEPAVALIAAVAALHDAELARAERYLDQVGRDPSVHTDPPTRLLHAATLVCDARLRGKRTRAPIDVLDKCGEAVGHDSTLNLFATANRGMLRMLLGEFAESEADLTEALRLARRSDCELLVLECLSHLAATAATRSDFGSMAARAGEAITFATEHGWEGLSRLKPTYVAAAWAAWQTLDDVNAGRYVSLAAAIDADVEPEADFAADVVGAFVDFESGADRHSAVARLRSLWADAKPRWLTPANICQFCFGEVQMALSIAEAGWAAEAADRAERLVGDTGDLAVMRARLHVHHGKEGLARKVLAPLLGADASCHLVSSEIVAWLLEAHVADANNEPSRAHESVVRAIELAAPRRAMRDVANASSRVRRLLVRGQGRYGVHDQFVQDVLEATSDSARGSSALGIASGESLTAREVELLRDLPSLLSLDEIAAAHVVSVNTVKTHLKALYRKLDVGSRRAAVERARELGLL